MNSMQIKLCDIQGRLFELSLEKGFDSTEFVKQFMNSKIAAYLDSIYNRMQWAGEEYLLAEIADECGLKRGGKLLTKDELFWMGYLYRYWHFHTGESSKKIYKQANIATMRVNYLMFHTMSPEMAIEDLKEICRQKKN